MTLKIYVRENRTFSGGANGFILGTTLENDVTILKFILPDALKHFDIRYLIFVNDAGTFKPSLDAEDSVNIEGFLTDEEDVQLQLVLKDSSTGEIWRSKSYNARFYASLNETGDNYIDRARRQQRETDRSELGNAVAIATNDPEDKDKLWDALIQIVKELEPKQFGEIVELIYNKLWSYYKEWYIEIIPRTDGDILED